MKLAVLTQDRKGIILRSESLGGEAEFTVNEMSKQLKSGTVPITLREFKELTGLTGTEAQRLHTAAFNQVTKAMKLIAAAVLTKEGQGVHKLQQIQMKNGETGYNISIRPDRIVKEAPKPKKKASIMDSVASMSAEQKAELIAFLQQA